MNTICNIKMDLTKPDPMLSVNAVQGDAYSRVIRISLYNGIQPWGIPDSVTAAVRYLKPDHTKGYYDTLPDGTSAWSVQEHHLTIRLAPQMLTVAGCVKAQVELIQEAHLLSTFCLNIHVEANPAHGTMKSEDYINWLQWIQAQCDAQVTQVQQSAQIATLASHTAAEAAELAAASETSAGISASRALDAAASASSLREETAIMAARVSSLVANNEVYTKQESDFRYSPAIVQTKTGKAIITADSANAPFPGLKLFGKTIQNGTPTPAVPVPLNNAGDQGNVEVMVYGKNLLNMPLRSVSANGMHFAAQGSEIVFYGTATSRYGDVCLVKNSVYFPAGTYTLSMDGLSAISRIEITRYAAVSGAQIDVIRLNGGTSKHTYTLQEDCTFQFIFVVESGTNLGTEDAPAVIRIQLESGTAATEYTPYQDVQTITIPTPGGLPGIPVASGGNYTDSNGQQWICDAVDFAAGMYLRRIGRIDHFSGEEIPGLYLSTTGEKTEGASILYVLSEEQHSPLTADVLTSYEALHANCPNTTIFSNSQAEVEVTYLTDIKQYIDNKLKASA